MNRCELKDTVHRDALYYNGFPKKEKIKMMLTRDHFYIIHKYMIYLRHEEYWRNISDNFSGGGISCIAKLVECYYALRKNCIGNSLGFYIKPGTLGAGTILYHHGSIIINGGARLGINCRLHGNNCIGNDGENQEAPHIGNNVEIGFGAVIIGNVHIADNVKIGAGAVVVNDCLQSGATLVGIPAHIVNKS